MNRDATVLVVDDDASVRSAVVEALTRSGYRTRTAGDGREGLEAAHRYHPDVVLSDLRMPGMDGLALLSALKTAQPATPVILFTAYGEVDEAVAAMKAGALDFVRKPLQFADLESAVRRAVASGRHAEDADADPFVRADAGAGTREDRGRRAVGTRGAGDTIAQSPAMQRVLALARDFARSRATVLLRGESGTGKEVVARYVHHHSDRAGGPFVAVNCAALPETLLESELFGHERGAFSGAIQARAGKFELARGGTLLLDEVSEMALGPQAKLLRVLQEFEVDRLGGRAPVPVDVRVIATTNRDLARMVREGTFRQDLYFRINVLPIELPPLRERPEDVEVMAQHFVTRHATRNARAVRGVTRAALARLAEYRWPGNVREMLNTLERAVLLCDGDMVRPEHLVFEGASAGDLGTTAHGGGGGGGGAAGGGAAAGAGPASGTGTIRDMERRMILDGLDAEGQNRTRAAKRLGISVRTLRNKIRELRAEGILPPAADAAGDDDDTGADTEE